MTAMRLALGMASLRSSSVCSLDVTRFAEALPKGVEGARSQFRRAGPEEADSWDLSHLLGLSAQQRGNKTHRTRDHYHEPRRARARPQSESRCRHITRQAPNDRLQPRAQRAGCKPWFAGSREDFA